MKLNICIWNEIEDGYYETGCGDSFYLEQGNPDENRMKFCCFCGDKLEYIKYTDEDDELNDQELENCPGIDR